MKLTRWGCFLVVALGTPCGYGQAYQQVFTPPAQGVVIDTSNMQVLTNKTYPQIVRVSYVQGDVRVSRGKAGEKLDKSEWEQAEVDLPLEAGFSLVTGAGRAEIEFEDASIVYLAENSVLVFNELSSRNGVPKTELGLLSGTLTMAVQPMDVGEWFAVRTPTDRVSARFPDKAFVRVNSYLDAMALTAEGDMLFRVDRTMPVQSKSGTTMMFRSGMRVFPDKPVDQKQFAQWDQWVDGQLTSREQAMASTMKEARLAEPLPGLDQMKDQGSFYPCAPYGTCWEPKAGWAGAQVSGQAIPISAGQLSAPLMHASTSSIGTAYTQPDEDFFPCSPFRVRSEYMWDPMRQIAVRRPRLLNAGWPYEWTVCHTGSWIRREHRYVWVVGRKRHHHPPVRWVKANGKVGFVPLHPRDVAGKPPLNLKDGIYRPIDRKTGTLEHIAYSGDKPVKVLDEAPKKFVMEDLPRLARAEPPRVEARMVKPGAPPAPVTFDHKSQSFMVERTSLQAGARPVVEPIGGRGSALQGQVRGASDVARSSSGGGSSSGVARAASSSYSGGGGGSVSHASAAPASAPAAAPAPAAPAASAASGKPH